MNEPENVNVARSLALNAASILEQVPSFNRLEPATRDAIKRDLATIQSALGVDPYAMSLGTPGDLAALRGRMRQGGEANSGGGAEPAPPAPGTPGPRVAATETLAARAGALSDEIDFPGFVAGLIHGTFDAMVDATIRQMEEFANLVSAVAKDVDRFTADNVTAEQARISLVEAHPRDLELAPVGSAAAEPLLQPRPRGDDDPPLAWLADYGLEGEELTTELIEAQLVPAERQKVGESRLQLLATMVLLGMSRINIKDGTISARVRFRAAARDRAVVEVAQGQGGGSSWGDRGSQASASFTPMVSTVGVNVQADSDLKVELFGAVDINFVSETLPLDRFVDSARMSLLQRNARWSAPPPSASGRPALAPASPSVEAAPAAEAAPAPVPAPVPVPAPGVTP